MKKSWKRMEVLLGLLVLGIGGIVMVVAGIWIYVSATATPLHPDAQSVPSAADADPSRRWVAPVEHARKLMRAQVAEQNLPGASVAVGIGADIIWAEGFGFADLDRRITVTPQTRFRIGTVSTVLTSAAVGLLLEQGKLNLDDVIQKHVPEFPEKQWPITLRQVMGHVAGVRQDSGDEGTLLSKRCEKTIEGVHLISEGSLWFEPGTEYRFSNYGFILVSAAVEAAAGTPFPGFMRTRIFEPLGMNDTLPDFANEPVANKAISYFPRFAADPRYGPDLMREVDYSCYAGAAAFASTPSDLVRFGMAINNGRLLQPATVELLQTEQRLSNGQQTGYGLGWDVDNVSINGLNTRAIGHDGVLLGGPIGSLLTLRDRRLVVAVVSNTSYVDAEGIAVKIAEAFAPPTVER